MPVAETLAKDHTLALSPAILAHLLRYLAEMTLHKIDPYQSGPLWVFQLWLQVYFVNLRPELANFSSAEVLDLQVASRPVPPRQAKDVFRYFFGLDTRFDDEFLIYRHREYPLSIKLPTSAWSADENADLRQSWGSLVFTRNLPLGCCPVPLLTSRSLLSRGRLSSSSEKECKDAEKEFQERCQKFRIRPTIPESLCTDTFDDWWEEYTQHCFGTLVEDVLSKVFGGRPKKASARQSQSSRSLKKVEVVATTVAEKKSTFSKRAKTTAQALLSKQPRQEAEATINPSRPAKRVKKLAKKEEQKIHVIFNQTTGTTTPSVSPSAPVVPASTERRPLPAKDTTPIWPVSKVVEAAVASSIEAPVASGPIAAPVLERQSSRLSKPFPKIQNKQRSFSKRAMRATNFPW
ncbi:hypothetical protein ACFXTI_013226 [Malus domestica]